MSWGGGSDHHLWSGICILMVVFPKWYILILKWQIVILQRSWMYMYIYVYICVCVYREKSGSRFHHHSLRDCSWHISILRPKHIAVSVHMISSSSLWYEYCCILIQYWHLSRESNEHQSNIGINNGFVLNLNKWRLSLPMHKYLTWFWWFFFPQFTDWFNTAHISEKLSVQLRKRWNLWFRHVCHTVMSTVEGTYK